jgi:Ca2+-binding RTX toxin-like protein
VRITDQQDSELDANGGVIRRDYCGIGDLAILVDGTGASIFIRNFVGAFHTYMNHDPFVAPTGFDMFNLPTLHFSDGVFALDDGHPNVAIVRGAVAQYDVARVDYAAGVAESGGGQQQGTSGDDDLSGGIGDDLLEGGDGDDSFTTSGGQDVIDGGAGDDTIRMFGGLANFTFTRDPVTGQIEIVDATGLEGSIWLKSIEHLYSAADNAEHSIYDVVGYWGTPGDDPLVQGNANANRVYGLAGNDLLRGLAGADLLEGGEGDDILDGGEGADTLRGGLGNDVYLVDSLADTVFEAANEGQDRVNAGLSYALGAGQSVEILATTDDAGTAAVNLTGNMLAQELIGNAGANVLHGGGGADLLRGLGGNDVYYVDVAAVAVTEAAGGGTDIVYASLSYVLAGGAAVETLSVNSYGATAAINLTGNSFAQTLIGNAGANVLHGGGGVDILIGLGGNDVYYVDVAGTQIAEAAGGGADIVYASLGYTLGANVEVETLSTNSYGSTQAINLTGNAFGQTLIGNAGANILHGGGGADTLIGLGGNDVYYVDVAGTQVSEAAGAGADTVYSSIGYTLAAGCEVETLSTNNYGATAAIGLTGNAFGQALVGNAGANFLDGGAGADTLYGLGGADDFAFTTALGATNVDYLADFSATDDTIRLGGAVFTAIGAPGALNANAFHAGAAAHDADDRILYDAATGQVFYDADGNGAGAAVQFATLAGAPALTAADFVVI